MQNYKLLTISITNYKYSKWFLNLRIMASKKNQKANQLTQQQSRQAELLQMKKNDPAYLKQDIFRLKEQLQDIVKKKEQLETEIAINKQQSVKKTYKIQVILKQQEEQIIQIQNRCQNLQQKQAGQIQQLVKRFQNQQLINAQKKQKQILEKNEQFKMMTQKVSYLKNYPERKKKYEVSIEELNRRLQKMEKQQQKDIKNIQNHHLKQRQRLDKDTKSQMQRIKQSEVNRLQQKMSRQQFIKKQNQVMQTQIALCQEQLQILNKQCAQLKNQIQTEKAQMGENTLGSQASETYERSLRIIKLQGKLTKLKTYLSQQTTKLQKQYEDIDGLYTKQHQQIQQKISKLQGWMRIKERDLKKVKACSQMVLNQRSNLESYLLQVFGQHPEIEYKDERNINKILRYLFAKINSKKPPVTYKQFLPQNLKSLSASSFRA